MESAKKQAIHQYCDAVGRGDVEQIRSLVTEDYTHTFLGSTNFAGTRTLPELIAVLESFSAALASPGTFTFHEMAEEGDLVIAIFSGKCELANGNRFDGDYGAAFRFRGDKILSLRELVDTKLADSAFG
ncbi:MULTISPECIES: nuclear transport factor 2 family protein [Sphingobium]|uniref:nuclear transport factor 2 family protein n=1 Tax=Sphingobium TaxID=165695 RepID=UPI00159BFD96|nr:nuclear transport factor 2 family protein [Sphingobium sp. 15-1]